MEGKEDKAEQVEQVEQVEQPGLLVMEVRVRLDKEELLEVQQARRADAKSSQAPGGARL